MIDDKVHSMVKRVQTGNIDDLSEDQRNELKKRKLILQGYGYNDIKLEID